MRYSHVSPPQGKREDFPSVINEVLKDLAMEGKCVVSKHPSSMLKCITGWGWVWCLDIGQHSNIKCYHLATTNSVTKFNKYFEIKISL